MVRAALTFPDHAYPHKREVHSRTSRGKPGQVPKALQVLLEDTKVTKSYLPAIPVSLVLQHRTELRPTDASEMAAPVELIHVTNAEILDHKNRLVLAG